MLAKLGLCDRVQGMVLGYGWGPVSQSDTDGEHAGGVTKGRVTGPVLLRVGLRRRRLRPHRGRAGVR